MIENLTSLVPVLSNALRFANVRSLKSGQPQQVESEKDDDGNVSKPWRQPRPESLIPMHGQRDQGFLKAK